MIWFVLLVAFAAMYLQFWRSWRTSVRLADTLTSPPHAVPQGRAETSGTAAIPVGLPPVGHDNSVWCEYELERYRSSRRGGGSWHSHAKVTSGQHFFVVDGLGGTSVHPTGAAFDVPAQNVPFEQYTLNQIATLVRTPAVADSWVKDHNIPIADLPGSWRVMYRSIQPGSTITVVGPVTSDPSRPGESAFAQDPSSAPSERLLVCPGTAAHNEQRLQRRALRLLPLPLIPLIVGGTPGLVLALVAWGAMLVRHALDLRNRLSSLATQADAAWAVLDAALTRRAGLLRNLEQSAADTLAQDPGLRRMIIAARWQPRPDRTGLDPSAATLAADQVVAPRLAAFAAQHPELPSTANLASLHSDLLAVEGKIVSARATHNAATALVLARAGSFPSSVLARGFAARRQQFFQI